MKELENILKREIILLEEKINKLNSENSTEKNEIEELNNKIKSLEEKKNKLSLTLSENKTKLDLIEGYYYSVDKLKDIEEKIKQITEDDLANIDKIDSIIDGKTDDWKVDIELAKYYLLHKDSIEKKSLNAILKKINTIYLKIKKYENQYLETATNIEEELKTALKTIKDYQKRIDVLKKNIEEREKTINDKREAISTLKSIDEEKVTEINPRFLEKLRKSFDTPEQYLEVLKSIVKRNSTLLRTNTKLESLILSVKERLDNASSFSEKETLSELYLLLLYSNSDKNKEDIIIDYLESIDYKIDNIKDFLLLIDLDEDEKIKENQEKITKLIRLNKSNINKPINSGNFNKFLVVKNILGTIKKDTPLYRMAKYLVIDNEESIKTIYDYSVLLNVYNSLKKELLKDISRNCHNIDNRYVQSFAKIVDEIVRNSFDSNINENDINNYQILEEKILSINTTDRELMIKALSNKELRKDFVKYSIYDEDGKINMPVIKDILLEYKKQELNLFRAKVDKSSNLSKNLSQIHECLYNNMSDDFIDDFIVTDLKSESEIKELLDNHLYEIFGKRKEMIKSLGEISSEEVLELYEEIIVNTGSSYSPTFEKMKKDIEATKSLDIFKDFFRKIMIKFVEEDLKNNTNSSSDFKQIISYIQNIRDEAVDNYKIYEYLPKFITSLGEIDIDKINYKGELLEEIKNRVPQEIKDLLTTKEEEIEQKTGTLIIFRSDNTDELIDDNVNQNEYKKQIENGLTRLQKMDYEALTSSKGKIDVIKNAYGIQGLYRMRVDDIRICYRVIDQETINTLNKNNDFSFDSGIFLFYIVKKNDEKEIYDEKIVPLAKEFIDNEQDKLIEELRFGSKESVSNFIKENLKMFKKLTGQEENAIGAKSYE